MAQLRREPVLCITTAAVTALLGWRLYDLVQNPIEKPRWTKKDRDVAPVRVADLQQFPSPAPPDAARAKRDLYASPRDTRPLPKLQIGAGLVPPLPQSYPWLMPPPVPAPGIKVWHTYLRTPAAAQNYDFTLAAAEPEAAPGGGSTQGGAGAPPSNGSGAPGDGNEPPASQAAPAKLDEKLLEKRYDRIVPRQGTLVWWGRVLNPRKYDIKEDEPILFQDYDVRAEKSFGRPREIPRADVLSYQLAKTIKNEIEIRKRKVAWIAGNEGRIREFALWCIEQGSEELEAFAEAERQLKKALELAPSDPNSSLAIAKLYIATYRYEDAWKRLCAMTEGEFKANAAAWVARAELEQRLHLERDAQASLERAAQLDANNFLPKLALGEFYLSQGRADAAVALLEAALRNEPGGVENATIRARIRRRLAEAALALGDFKSAADAFDKARKAEPSDAGAAAGAAVVLWLQKQPGPALELLNTQIAAGATAGALVTRGLIRITNKDYAGAKIDFESAVGLDPVRDVRPLSAIAFLYLLTGHDDEALAAVERALVNDPTDAYAHYLRGRLRRDAGDRAGSREDLKIAAMADLGFVDPLAELGIIDAGEEFFELADRYYAKAAEFDPKNADILALRGLNLLLWGQTRRAKEGFIAAISIVKDQPVARIGLALCHYLDDNPSAMKAELALVRDGRPEGDRFRDAANQTLKIVDIHERKEEWVDGFERASISGEWSAERVQGIEVKCVGGEVRVQGLFESAGPAKLNYRKYRLAEFCSFEADVKIPAAGAKPEDHSADLVFYLRKEEQRAGGQSAMEFEIAIKKEARRTDGAAPVKLLYRSRDATPLPREIPFAWPVDKAVHIKIEVNDDDTSPRARVLIDNQIVASDLAVPKSTANVIDLGVEVFGQTGNLASVSIDNVRIVKRNLQ